jgi:hypothetical protein
LHTQRLLSAGPSGGPPMVLVLSNAHRLVALYPTDSVAPVVRAIVETGAILFMTFADSPPEGRLAFDTVMHVEGNDPMSWNEATLRVEKGPASGPLRAGSEHRLGQLPPIASVLANRLM